MTEKSPCSAKNGFCLNFDFYKGPEIVEYWKILQIRKIREKITFDNFYSLSPNNTYTTDLISEDNKLELRITPTEKVDILR